VSRSVEEAVEIHSIVIVTLGSPKEKIWGELHALNSAGITVRGIDINSFDDFIRQIVRQEEVLVGMATYRRFRIGFTKASA